MEHRKPDGENGTGEERGRLTEVGKNHVCGEALQEESDVRGKWVY